MFLCHRVHIDAPCQSENIKGRFIESIVFGISFQKRYSTLPLETSAEYVRIIIWMLLVWIRTLRERSSVLGYPLTSLIKGFVPTHTTQRSTTKSSIKHYFEGFLVFTFGYRGIPGVPSSGQ